MIIFQVTLLVLIALGLDGSLRSPEFNYENGDEVAPPFCREATVEERIADGFGPQGKTSAFNIWGYYRCEHNIFEYGERNSYYDFVANNAAKKADEVALKIAKMTDVANAPELDGHSYLHIEVISDAIPVIPHLRSVFQSAIVQHAPKVRVVRLADGQIHASKLRVVLRRLDDQEQYIGVSLLKSSAKNQEWIDL